MKTKTKNNERKKTTKEKKKKKRRFPVEGNGGCSEELQKDVSLIMYFFSRLFDDAVRQLKREKKKTFKD